MDAGPDVDAPPLSVPGSAAPWTVAISEGGNLQRDFVCAGVLIDPQWALTAAHCTFNMVRRWPNDAQPVAFTETSALDAPGRAHAIEEIVPHPEYDARTLRHDIALIRLAGRSESRPLGFEGPPIAEQMGEIATILGFGITTGLLKHQHREKLQLVQIAVIDHGVCFSSVNYPGVQQGGVFCGNSLLKHHDVCFRFGGSPLVLYDSGGRLYVAGLVSWPAICPVDYRKPHTYLDVHAYAPWIRSVIAGRGERR